jgi:hypothetical protein
MVRIRVGKPACLKKDGPGARQMPERTFEPAWVGLKGYDDHQDDKQIDSEWGETREKHDRREHDKKVRSGGSPPPKDKGRNSSTKSCENT